MVKEKTVRISDLFFGILSHWKAIIVFIVIGAVVGAGYSFIKSGDKKSGDSGITMKVTDAEKDTIALYVKYSGLYDDQLDYIQSDSLMLIDPANTYRCSQIYYLGCDEADKVDGILQAYDIKLDELSDKYGKPNAFSIKKNQNTLITDDFTNVITSEGTNCVISVVAYGTSPDDCISLLDEVDEYLFEKKTEIEEAFGKHTVTSFRGEMSKAPMTGIITRQKEAIDTLNSINTSMTNLKKNLSEDFIAVLDYCAENHREYENTELIPDKINTSGDDADEKEVKRKIDMKLIALGAVAGLVVAIIIFAIAYSVRATIAPEDDTEEIFGIPLFAAASGDEHGKTAFDRAIAKKRRRRLPMAKDEGDVELAASNIKVSCRMKNINKVYVTGSVITESERNYLGKVADRLKKDNIELVCGRSILVFPEALEESAEAGNVVLLEKTGKSRFEEIKNEIRKCSDNSINILGMIVWL